MRKSFSRVNAVLLAVLLCASLLPQNVAADETTTEHFAFGMEYDWTNMDTDFETMTGLALDEILGDVTCNKIIVWYLKNRFPFLNNTKGVKVIARLKINYVAKARFSKWALQLGFEKYISFLLSNNFFNSNSDFLFIYP